VTTLTCRVTRHENSASLGFCISLWSLYFILFFFLSTYSNGQGVYIPFTGFLFVFLCVCTVTDFSAEDKASGVKFCTVVHRRPEQEISHFGNSVHPEAQNRTNRLRRPCWAPRHRRRGQAQGPRVGSPRVDIRPSPKTDVHVLHIL